MKAPVAAALIASIALFAPGAAGQNKTRTITVEVVDQAGGIVYLEPGEDAGLRPGDTVRLGRRSYRVKRVAGNSATIDVGKRILRLGSKGRARVGVREAGVEKRPPPPPLAVFRGRWSDPVVPASEQNPTPVPIGHIRRTGPHELVITASSSSLFPFGDGRRVTRATVRAQLRSEPFSDVPFGVDADVEAGKWIGRGLSRDLGADSRPIAQLHELRVRYGRDRDNPIVGLGRLRYASSTVGLLDGVRTSSPSFGGVSVFAFGGLVPSTLDGRPSTDLSRFGIGASYLNAESPWRPSAELTAYGSYFDGGIDERRLAGNARIYPGPLSIGARGELSAFDSDNPWGARRLEVTFAGVDTTLAYKRLRASLSLDAIRPERSRWLASLLPQSWLCTASATDVLPEPCSSARTISYYAMATTALGLDRISVQVGGTAIANQVGDVQQRGVYLDFGLPKIFGRLSADIGAMATQSDLIDTRAARVGAGYDVGHGLDLSAYYRPAILVYQAAAENLFEHRVGATAFYGPLPSLWVRLSTELVAGPDVSALGVFSTVVFRP